MNLKKGIQVKIISGKDKGKTGEILEINKKRSSGAPKRMTQSPRTNFEREFLSQTRGLGY